MAFVWAAVPVGAYALREATHDKHSRYSEYERHSKYGDAQMRAEIERKESEVNRKETDVANLRRRMQNNFDSRISELRREKNYSGLDSWLPSQMINSVKDDMRRELNNEISRDRQELAEIDKMIGRINELELQSRRE